MRITAIAILACLLPASATGFARAQAYPLAVRAVLDEARKYCRDQGGRRVEFDRTTVRKVDLAGDGRDGFIIDHTYTRWSVPNTHSVAAAAAT